MSDVTTALAKSKVAWLLVPPDSRVPCWYAAVGGTAYLVGGPGEQPLPELPAELGIILRDKETRAAVGPIEVRAARVMPDADEWQAATTALLAARQNTPAGDRPAFWAEHCTVWALQVEPGELPTGHTEAAQPGPTAPD